MKQCVLGTTLMEIVQKNIIIIYCKLGNFCDTSFIFTLIQSKTRHENKTIPYIKNQYYLVWWSPDFAKSKVCELMFMFSHEY